MDRTRAEKAAEVFKALGHPLRLKIVELVARREKTVGQIVAAMKTKPAITSQQLSLLKSRGVLTSRRDGGHVYYRLRNKNVIKVLDCVCRKKP